MYRHISAGFLFLSGLLVTLTSIFFSIHGFLLFLSDKELYYGVLLLGISFEIGKVVTSTFLFHNMKDKAFPLFFKGLMTFIVVLLIGFSSIFTFVHLNNSISQNMGKSEVVVREIQELERTIELDRANLSNINTQIANLPSNNVKGRIRLMRAFEEEKTSLTKKINENTERLSTLNSQSIQEDGLTFLNSLSEYTGWAKRSIYTFIILFVVVVIDPLAISMFLAASFIVNKKKENKLASQYIKM